MAWRGRSAREWQEEVERATRSFGRRKSRRRLPIVAFGLFWLILGGIIGVFTFTILPDGLRAVLESGQEWVSELTGKQRDDQDSNALSVLVSPTPRPSVPEKEVFPALPPAAPLPPFPTVGAPSERLVELRRLALDLINQDRSDHGVPPVELGSNVAAQLHAEDMLDQEYSGHWWIGRKPYMVYTQTGGTSYVAENVASSGWTKQRWDENNCDSFLVICKVPEPDEEVERAEWDMMYDDAHANWGHRDNILGSTHRFVNLGIAWNERLTIFVQHFEGGDVAAISPPRLGTDGTLSLKLTKLADGLELGGAVGVYYDPPPRQKTPEQIEVLDSYCLGGGFTIICAEPIATILKPPPSGSFYSNLKPGDVIAEVWNENSTEFSLLAELGSLATDPGVYTVVVWRDSPGPLLTDAVLELSTIQQ